jgi:hypothetical protein
MAWALAKAHSTNTIPSRLARCVWQPALCAIMNTEQSFFFVQVFYVACTIPIKASICIALLRIAPQKRWRIPLHTVLAVGIIGATVTEITILCQAKPLSAMWTGRGKMMTPSIILKVSYMFSATSILTDCALAVLPTIILRRVRIPAHIKKPLIVVLALGFMLVS